MYLGKYLKDIDDDQLDLRKIQSSRNGPSEQVERLVKVFAPGGCEVVCHEGNYSVCATSSAEMGEKLYEKASSQFSIQKTVEFLKLK